MWIIVFLQPGLRSIWEKYYEEAHAVMFVVDAACPSRFEDAKSALGTYFNPYVLRILSILSYYLVLIIKKSYSQRDDVLDL